MFLNIVNILDKIAVILLVSFVVLIFFTTPILIHQMGYIDREKSSRDSKIRNLRYGMNINDIKDEIGYCTEYETRKVLIYKDNVYNTENYKYFIKYKLIFNEKGEYISTNIHKYRVSINRFD